MGSNKVLPKFSLNSFVSPAQTDWYKNLDYQDAKSIIREKMKSSVENFIAIGYHLKHIDETGQYKEDGYANIWECAKQEFGFSQPKASRCINICKAYSVNGDSPYIDERFKNFNTSQLQEMLPFKDDEHLIGQITPNMSSREIRKEIRNAKKEDMGDGTLQGQQQITTIEGEYREFAPVSDISDSKVSSANAGRAMPVEIKAVPSTDDVKPQNQPIHAPPEMEKEISGQTDTGDIENTTESDVGTDAGVRYDPERVTIHLPAEVGDTVYFIGRDDDINKGTIDQITLGEGMRPLFRVYDTESGAWFHFEVSDFGQMLFYSHEDAETVKINRRGEYV